MTSISSNILQPVGIPVSQDYWSMRLDNRYVLQEIVQIKNQYRSMSYLMSKIGNPVRVDKQLVEQGFYDWSAVPTAQSTGVTLSNQNQTASVTLQSNVDVFVNKKFVTDSNTGVKGRVIAHSAGNVTVEFVSSPVSGVKAFTSSDFNAGAILTQDTVGSLNYNDSRSFESQYGLPDLRKIVVGTFGNSVSLSKKDMIEKNRIERAEANGIKYLAWFQVEKMLSEYVSGLEKIMVDPNQVQVLPDQNGNNGQVPSLPWQIKNEGGYYMPMTATPSQNDLKEAITYIRDQKGSGCEIMLVGGSDLMGALQSDIARSWLTYAGNTNTFGGNTVKGINFKEYTYLDVTIKFYSDFNDFNHNGWFPAMSSITGKQKSRSSFMMFDTDMVETSNGSLPFLTNYFYGLPSDSSDGKYQRIENGNIDGNGAFPDTVTGDTPVVTYSIHQSFAPVLNKPQNCVFGELAS